MINYWNAPPTLDLGTYPKNQEMYFLSSYGTDTEAAYDANPHSKWGKYSVSYKYNSYGFRSREFDINVKILNY